MNEWGSNQCNKEFFIDANPAHQLGSSMYRQNKDENFSWYIPAGQQSNRQEIKEDWIHQDMPFDMDWTYPVSEQTDLDVLTAKRQSLTIKSSAMPRHCSRPTGMHSIDGSARDGTIRPKIESTRARRQHPQRKIFYQLCNDQPQGSTANTN